MELLELYDLIGLQPEMIRRLRSVGRETNLKQIEPYLRQLADIRTAPQAYRDLKTLFEEDKDNMAMLYCQLECARRTFDRYEEKHIGKAIYVDTMRCFTRFIEECKKKNGRMFFDRGWWTYRQISMSLFRIGELEYEFKEYEGENVIALHIPSDADLSKEAVDESMKQAAIFFQTCYGEYEYRKYICNSWLMVPVLARLLSEGSNILSFQKRFDILKEDKTDKEYIEWLFQVPVDTDHGGLPAHTSLQKKVKELLLSRGTVGSAFGIIEI